MIHVYIFYYECNGALNHWWTLLSICHVKDELSLLHFFSKGFLFHQNTLLLLATQILSTKCWISIICVYCWLVNMSIFWLQKLEWLVILDFFRKYSDSDFDKTIRYKMKLHFINITLNINKQNHSLHYVFCDLIYNLNW